MNENEIETELCRAWDILEVDAEEALRITDALPPEVAERHLVRAHAKLDLLLIDESEAELDKAALAFGEEQDHVRFVRGRLRFLQWRIEEARQEFEVISHESFYPEVFVFRAMCAEVEGDLERSDELYARAIAVSNEGYDPPRFTPDEFKSCVGTAADALPPLFREAFERVVVVIDSMPTKAIVDFENTGHPPDILGLFVGAPLSEGEPLPGELPPTIFLFQRNLERFAASKEELIEEIQVTLYHELGHALGFDEDDVEHMGLA